MNSRSARLFREYAAAHATAGNRRCHSIGIPLIVASVVAALVRVRIGGPWTLAEPVILGVGVAQVGLDPVGAAAVLAFEIAVDLLSRRLPAGAVSLGIAAAAFAIGWAFQFLGHAVYEKNRPAFARNLVHLVVGPLWIAEKMIGRGLSG